MGRREDKREATRQEILNAASTLFRERGYDATSVDDIVLSANLAKGTFYYHFQKKDDLVLALQEAHLKIAAAGAQKMLDEGESPKRVLIHYLDVAAHWMEDNAEIAKAMARHKLEQMQGNCPAEHQGPPPAIKELFFGFIAQLIAKAQEKSEIRNDLRPEEIAQVLIPVVMMSARMGWAKHSSVSSPSENLKRSLCILFEGLDYRPKI